MSSNCDNYWLIDLVVKEKLPYSICRFVAIHERHIAVHQYELEAASSIFLKVFLDYFYSLETVEGSN